MYYILDERYALRGWQKLPFALVDRRIGRTTFLPKADMALLLDMDGRTDQAGASEERKQALKKLEEDGIIHPCEPGTKLKDYQRYKFYDNRYIRTAHWSVTGRCNYRCKHCYMSAPEPNTGSWTMTRR